jgi:hypothetical protein
MSTPEQPATPALTRKQLRDIRNTGATPIISSDVPRVEDAPVQDAPPPAQTPVEESADPTEAHEVSEVSEAVQAPPQHVAAPLPRAAVPAVVHDLPGADASVDLGVSPLTRRQARQQERIRTASVPVITPEVAAAHAASVAAAAAKQQTADKTPSGEVSLAQLFGTDAVATVTQDDAPADEQDAVIEATVVEEDSTDRAADAAPPAASDAAHTDTDAEHAASDRVTDTAHEDTSRAEPEDEDAAQEERAIVNPQFGAQLLAGDVDQVELPASFDQLISRSVTGAIGTGNALILSQTPSAPPLVSPVAATGEVLITGSFNLPEGLGSNGHAAGTTDGKEVDAVLVDGELPAHSSPTPIAASAAISTVKNGGDIIKPPTPEKGGRLMLTLAITAGVLALALVGVLILAFVTGVF